MEIEWEIAYTYYYQTFFIWNIFSFGGVIDYFKVSLLIRRVITTSNLGIHMSKLCMSIQEHNKGKLLTFINLY